MKLSELGFLLEYEDERSILNWCKKNKIPVVHAGKAKYVLNDFINQFFKNDITKFVNQHYDNPIEIMNAIESDNPLQLSELMDEPVIAEVARKYKAKDRSKASKQFLDNIKAA